MRIKFDTVQNPKQVNFHTVTGVLPSGDTIEVSRRHAGWAVHLAIRVNGVLLHNDTPSITDKEEFSKLMDRTMDLDYKDSESKREEALSAAWKEVFSNDI